MKISEQASQMESLQSSESNYKKILVAVDDLASACKIFNQALNLAKINGADLMIFHCVQREMPGIPEMAAYGGMGTYSGMYSQEMMEYQQQLIRETTEKIQVWLESFVRQATEKGVHAYSDYIIGDPGDTICALAQNWGADLIVIGRRGRRGLSELVLGSVSNYVIHHACCSVLVVQESPQINTDECR